MASLRSDRAMILIAGFVGALVLHLLNPAATRILWNVFTRKRQLANWMLRCELAHGESCAVSNTREQQMNLKAPQFNLLKFWLVRRAADSCAITVIPLR